MNDNLVWQQNSDRSDNKDNLEAIARWWSNLAGKEVAWQQRTLPSNGSLQDLDWHPQRFDEKFVMQAPQLRGITLYWRNDRIKDERNITPSKLQLNLTKQQLYVFPQSQSQVVISVNLPETRYQKLNLSNPRIAVAIEDGKGIILLRDETEKLEIKITLDSTRRERLRNLLAIGDNR